jgi:hypothetical protein
MTASTPCPLADTTLLWLFGEGPEDHIDHVVACAHCQQTVRVHEETLGAMAEAGAPEPHVAEPTARTPMRLILAGTLLAAAALLMLHPPIDPGEPGSASRPDTGQAAAPGTPTIPPPFADTLDNEIIDLDITLAWLAVELEPGTSLEAP